MDASDSIAAGGTLVGADAPPRAGRARWLPWAVMTIGSVGVAHALDPLAWRVLRLPTVYETDWGRLLRSVGYLPTWLLAAGLLWRQRERAVDRGRVAAFVALSATAGGLLAEVGKLLLRRLRPDPEAFGYLFRSFAEAPLSTRGLGLPSSHTLVAFAGASALAILFPRTRFLWLALAVGCALTRVMALAHFLSDVTLAAGLGWAVATLWARRLAITAC